MADSKEVPPNDPFDAWRQWIDRSERQLNTMLNEVTSSEQFGQVSSRMMETLLVFQRTMNESTQRYFSALNVPTRTDILSLGERLGAIEERLESLEAAIRDPQGSSRSRTAKPARTRRPPDAVVESPRAGATEPEAEPGEPAETTTRAAKRRKTTRKAGTAGTKAGGEKSGKKSRAATGRKKATGRKTEQVDGDEPSGR
ncbi:MAG: hypothetical protein DWQ36_11990 [Acidobacteria bacterium]|mgnify:CR=1 FL=1|nr:MAG: hypothetical protein DWQ36_11990 [Acidobacteriota bacterium]